MHNLNARNREPFDGNVSGEFTYKFCGRTFKDIRTMVLNSCTKIPTCGGHHSPAR